jgi:hypothetical protein
MAEKSKWVCGPGGIRCACCRRGSLRDAKRGHRRAVRHAAKREIETEE